MSPIPEPPSLAEIEQAAGRLEDLIHRIPLLPLAADGLDAEVFLKLECLQPIGSFKLRGAGNALALADPDTLQRGVWTASAGNMAQGVAWCARRLGVPCRVVVPDHAPRAKLEAIARLGAEVIEVPFDQWWQTILRDRDPGLGGLFVHPVADSAVIAGNATLGLEIVDDLPDVDTVLVPFGGGGLSCGIASALRLLRPEAGVIGCEVETAAPLAASLEAGRPQAIDYTPSFVDGIGGSSVLEEMWPLVSDLLAGSRVASLGQVASAMRHLVVRSRIVAEGAGATPVAVALAGDSPGRKVVCVVSGGNVDPELLARILAGSSEEALPSVPTTRADSPPDC